MRTCKVEGCEKKHFGKGLCNKHYSRLRKYNDINFTAIESHGMKETPEYITWSGMKSRCYNKATGRYKDYGARGITVCDKWRNSFIAFYEDMGKRPFPKAQIDRINNNEGYSKNNCRWVTNAENCHNTRKNVLNWFIVNSIRRLFNMKKYSSKQLCAIYNIKLATLENVIYNRSWLQ